MMTFRFVAAAAAAALPWPAGAATAIFTDLSAFQSAVGSTTLVDFDAATPTILASPDNPAVTGSYGDFVLSGTGNGDYVAVALGERGSINGSNFLYIGQFEPDTAGSILGDGGVGPTVTLTFASAIRAFGFDWTDLDDTDSYKVTFSGPDFTTIDYASPPFNLNGEGAGFFGFRSDSAFTTITFAQNQEGGFLDGFGIDNIRTNATLGVPGAVPEPATWAMLIIGFGVTGGAVRTARRRQQRTVAAI